MSCQDKVLYKQGWIIIIIIIHVIINWNRNKLLILFALTLILIKILISKVFQHLKIHVKIFTQEKTRLKCAKAHNITDG